MKTTTAAATALELSLTGDPVVVEASGRRLGTGCNRFQRQLQLLAMIVISQSKLLKQHTRPKLASSTSSSQTMHVQETSWHFGVTRLVTLSTYRRYINKYLSIYRSKSLQQSEVSSFLTAHQHILGYLVPYDGVGRFG